MTGRDPLTIQSGRRTGLILGVALVFLWGVPQSGSAAPGQMIAGYVQNADLRRVARATVELRDQEGNPGHIGVNKPPQASLRWLPRTTASFPSKPFKTPIGASTW